MPISNVDPQQRDVVIYQRDDTNSYWGEAHISGSNLIFYIDAQGHVNADNSSSFYTLFPPSSTSGASGTTLITGGLYPITSSWAISASWAPSTGGGSGTTLITGGLYQITASWALNSGTTLITGSTVPITASWALNALTSSYVTSSNVFGTVANATNAGTALTASYVTSSNVVGNIPTASVAINAQTASFAPLYLKLTGGNVSGQINMSAPLNMGSGQDIEFNTGATEIWDTSGYTVSAPATGLQQFQGPSGSVFFSGSAQSAGGIVSASLFIGNVTGSTFGTSSWAINALTSSYVTSSNVFGTVGNATNAGTARTASYITASNIAGIVPTASFALNFNPNATASYALNAGSASFALTASFVLNSSTTSTGRSLALCTAYTPAIAGSDSAQLVIPWDVDGITPVSWSVKRFDFRVESSGSLSSSVNIEKSTGSGIFTATTLGSVVLPANSYEGFTSGSLGSVNSGDKIRFNVITLGSSQAWTIITEISK